jgi:lichenan operon transcriptional antiterminator
MHQPNTLPDTSQARTDYLLVYLLNRDDYIKIDELSEFLCVSRSTLQASIKEVETLLSEYNISIDRKPNYGIRITGNEFDIRRCIGECFIKHNMYGIGLKIYRQEELDHVAERVMTLSEKYNIKMSETKFDNAITQIYVALKRIKRSHYLSEPDIDINPEQYPEWEMAEELSREFEKWQSITYPACETGYITIYLAGNRIVGGTSDTDDNFVIRETYDRLVLDMLKRIYDEFGIEFRNDFNLRMALNQHMVPFHIRIKYRIHTENPILDEIKQNFAFAYSMAWRACSVLAEYYGHTIADDEIGYFAMYLAAALEHRNTELPKANILIVCSVGRGSSQLLKYKYTHEFKEYLDNVYVCGSYDLSGFDFTKIDYVFTTVPIHQRIPVPIIEVGQFLDRSDIIKVREVLQRRRSDWLDIYFKEENFFTDIAGNTKEEVLKNICDKIAEQRELPDGFYEAVLKREELAQTDFGNLSAIPHPYKIITDDTFIYTAILQNEILWTKNRVQFVLLSAICAKEDKNLPYFYEISTRFLLREDMIERLIKEKSFDVFIQMLKEIYYG